MTEEFISDAYFYFVADREIVVAQIVFFHYIFDSGAVSFRYIPQRVALLDEVDYVARAVLGGGLVLQLQFCYQLDVGGRDVLYVYAYHEAKFHVVYAGYYVTGMVYENSGVAGRVGVDIFYVQRMLERGS